MLSRSFSELASSDQREFLNLMIGKNDANVTNASPVVATFYGNVREYLFFGAREQIEHYVSKIENTQGTADVEMMRHCIAADYAVRVFLPMALLADGSGKPDRLVGGFKVAFGLQGRRFEWANLCKSAAPIVDRPTAGAAWSIADVVWSSSNAPSIVGAAASAKSATERLFDNPYPNDDRPTCYIAAAAASAASRAAQDRSILAYSGEFGRQVNDVRAAAIECLDDLIRARSRLA
jgi:hypothetical protein